MSATAISIEDVLAANAESEVSTEETVKDESQSDPLLREIVRRLTGALKVSNSGVVEKFRYARTDHVKPFRCGCVVSSYHERNAVIKCGKHRTMNSTHGRPRRDLQKGQEA